MTSSDLATLGIWVAGTQLLLGVACLIVGFSNRDRGGEHLAPLGAMFVISAVFWLLEATVPHGILIPLAVLAFAGASVWFVRRVRISRARTRVIQISK